MTPWERLPGETLLGPGHPRTEISRVAFFRIVFRLAFQTALETHFFALEIEKPPKMEPKPSQNPAENASEIDLMLRTLRIESEQTLPHFS